MRSVVIAFVVLGLVTACASSLRTPCQQACYDRRSNEPADFDDCIKRCQR